MALLVYVVGNLALALLVETHLKSMSIIIGLSRRAKSIYLARKPLYNRNVQYKASCSSLNVQDCNSCCALLSPKPCNAIQKAVADESECACYRPMLLNHRCREFCKGHDSIKGWDATQFRMWDSPARYLWDDVLYLVQPLGISGQLHAFQEVMPCLRVL